MNATWMLKESRGSNLKNYIKGINVVPIRISFSGLVRSQDQRSHCVCRCKHQRLQTDYFPDLHVERAEFFAELAKG